ncbi:MAG: TlyA family RNA methyltransferase [Clostridia bacterium]|nr:TlyA family RNA methyltransferase [Clostridia bacterium]
MRLDLYLTEKEIYASRTRAERAVKAGCVKVNGATVTKCSAEVSDGDQIECLPDPLRYVSRGALKLEFALDHFGVDVKNKRAVDVGASTGGFTQVLLEKGAASVTAVDVGTGQLDPLLKNDGRVTSLEKTDVRTLDPERTGRFDVLTCDCSFISLKDVLPACGRLMNEGAYGIFLVKPQFEVGPGKIGKNGIVKDPAARRKCVREVTDLAERMGLIAKGPAAESPVAGGDGNVEYLLVLEKRR